MKHLRFRNAAFELLHRDRALRPCGTMGEFISYCEGLKRLFHHDETNHRVHQRLKYVLLSCPDGAPPMGKSFQMLAEEAFRLIPPIR